jgi:hypothetical protein
MAVIDGRRDGLGRDRRRLRALIRGVRRTPVLARARVSRRRHVERQQPNEGEHGN